MKQTKNPNLIRLNKYLADAGIDSRRKVEELITTGRVEVNGKTVTELSIKIDPSLDIICVDGEKVKEEKKVYFLLNKPKGFITSRSDEKNRPVVIDLIKTDKRIFPVGRLDRDTTGLLILTNDGNFANIFMHPKHEIEREYVVKLDRELLDHDKEKLLTGVYLDKKRRVFKKLYSKAKKSNRIYNVITTEGRYHFVKEMFKALGYHVQALQRIRFGMFILPDIKEGTYIKIDEKVIENIKKEYGY
jgi:pseudouridine synthase